MRWSIVLLVLLWGNVNVTIANQVLDCGEPEPLLNGGVSFLSVVQYRCNEPYYSLHGDVNVTFSCEADRKWRPIDDTGLTPVCLPVCGKPRVPLTSVERIIGGKAAPDESIPWHVRISGPNIYAGGVIIADRWILTGASALVINSQPMPHNTVQIFLGTNTIEENQVPNAVAASIHIHPGYKYSDNLNFDNDIALIKLPEAITFNSSIMPICLPSEGDVCETGIMGLVSGFGLVKDAETEHYYLTRNLTYVRLPVVNPRTCTDSVTRLRGKRTDIPNESANMFCAGFADGRMDTCQGDSGGPFALRRRGGAYWVAGIVSWGFDCAVPGTYGFYTRVANYVDWIRKIMKEN